MSYGAFTRALSDELGGATHTNWEDAHRRVFDRWLAEGRHEALIRYLTENFGGVEGGEEYINLLGKGLAEIGEPGLIRELYAPILSRRRNHFFWRQAQIRLHGVATAWIETVLQRVDPHRRQLGRYKASLLSLMQEFRTMTMAAGQTDVADIDRQIAAFERDEKLAFTVIPVVSRELNEDVFWQLIADARAVSETDDDVIATMEASLTTLNPNEILRFQSILSRLLEQSYRWDLWAAAYAMRGGCGDDEFDYFRQWLILQGKLIYNAALISPIAWALESKFEGSLQSEALLSAAPNAYRSKAGQEMQLETPRETKPRGDAWKESDFAVRFPELAARFGFD